jgi:hypothetical protein
MESDFFALKRAFSLKIGMYIVFFCILVFCKFEIRSFHLAQLWNVWFSETVDFTKLAADTGIACTLQGELPDMVCLRFLELRWIALFS